MMSLKHRRQASGSVSPGPAKSPKVADESDEAGPSSSSSSNRSDAANAAIQSSSLADFKRLPQELRAATLEMACYSRFDNGEGVSQLRLDTQMVANLASVSREFHSTFNPMLYRQISLDRPSKLNSFYQSLLSTPENAQHVESLHLGPLSDLPEEWWPFLPMSLVDDEDYEGEAIGPYRKRSHATIKTSLNKRDEALGLLPEWVEPEKVFAYQEEPKDCQEGAVLAAIRVALEGIGVDPYDELANATDQIIGIDKWTERLFQAQAVLDLYLCAMRRVEDNQSACGSEQLKQIAGKAASKCLADPCGHYPSVVLEGFEFLEGELRSGEVGGLPSTKKTKGSDKQTSAGQNEIVITREQVEAHLARKGAYTDHFDHPLMYARSDLRQLAISIWNRQVVVDYDREQEEDYYGEYAGSESADDLDLDSSDDDSSSSRHSFTSPSSPRRRSCIHRWVAKSCEPDELLDPRHRPGLVAIAHSVLDLTTKVRNLSLTGYFVDCLYGRPSGQDKATVLDEILYLSVGPLSPPSNAMHCIPTVKLAALEELRICGETVGQPTAKQLACQGEKSNWPRLKTVQWEFGHHWITWNSAEGLLLELLHVLQGRNVKGSGYFEDDDDEDSEDDEGVPSSRLAQPPPPPPQQLRLIEARMPPNLVNAMLRMAPNEETSAAWRNGSPAGDAPHILRLVESRAVKKKRTYGFREEDGEEETEEKFKEDMDVMREESRIWWEGKAVEYGRRRREGAGDDEPL